MIIPWAVYVHDLDPYALMLWEGGPIRWYGLSYLAGFIIGYLLIRRLAQVGLSTLDPQRAGDLVVAAAVGIVAGGRLGYVLLYRPDLLWEFSSAAPFWGLLAINQGGMASHGGLAGLILACLWYARRHGHSFPHLLDLTVFTGLPGIFLGRIANFINGELYGRPCAPDMALAVKFPQEMYTWNGSEPEKLDRLQEALAPLAPAHIHGQQLAAWAIARVQSGDRLVRDAIAPLLTPRHPSQLYEAAMEGMLVFVLLAVLWRKPRKPGVIFAACCVMYGLVRMVGEAFRLPDAHIMHQEFQTLGVTRGQWLSAVLALAGAGLLVVFNRRQAPLLGGWLSRR